MKRAVAVAYILLRACAVHAGISMMIDPIDLASVGPTLYVADLSGGMIWTVDTTSGSATKLANLVGVQAITSSADAVYACAAGQKIYRITADGTATVIAGNGTYGNAGNGGPATAASIGYCRGLAVDASGVIYFADSDFHVVRKIANGTITAFAGTGARGTTGDGGPALAAMFLAPYDVAIGGDGSVYILDRMDFTVRKVAPNGVVTLFAGQHLAPGFAGDGGPATQAKLYYPLKIDIDPRGDLLILDTNNNRLRHVDNFGTITTIAGNGTAGGAGDGGAATAAQLLWPSSLAVDSAGTIYVGNRSTSGQIWQPSNAVRQIDAAGTISTLIGYGNMPAATVTATAALPTATRTATSVPATPTRTVPPAGNPACDTWRTLGAQIPCQP